MPCTLGSLFNKSVPIIKVNKAATDLNVEPEQHYKLNYTLNS